MRRETKHKESQPGETSTALRWTSADLGVLLDGEGKRYEIISCRVAELFESPVSRKPQ
jgi:hypothetical protein